MPGVLLEACAPWVEQVVRSVLGAAADVQQDVAVLLSWLLGAFIHAGALAKFLGVFVGTLPLIVALGYAYRLSARSTWGASLYRMYSLLYGCVGVVGRNGWQHACGQGACGAALRRNSHWAFLM
jgi:hypothetical protein